MPFCYMDLHLKRQMALLGFFRTASLRLGFEPSSVELRCDPGPLKDALPAELPRRSKELKKPNRMAMKEYIDKGGPHSTMDSILALHLVAPGLNPGSAMQRFFLITA